MRPGPLARGGVPSATLETLRPLAAGSARRDFFLAPQAASSTPPHRPGSPITDIHAAGCTTAAPAAGEEEFSGTSPFLRMPVMTPRNGALSAQQPKKGPIRIRTPSTAG